MRITIVGVLVVAGIVVLAIFLMEELNRKRPPEPGDGEQV
jgi:hypothetical protein